MGSHQWLLHVDNESPAITILCVVRALPSKGHRLYVLTPVAVVAHSFQLSATLFESCSVHRQLVASCTLA